jgi:hypothetical protein
MKKVILNQSLLLKNTNFILINCYEFGAGSTYSNELVVLFIGKNGIIKKIKYKYSIENIYRLLDALFIPYKFDKKILNDLKKTTLC